MLVDCYLMWILWVFQVMFLAKDMCAAFRIKYDHTQTNYPLKQFYETFHDLTHNKICSLFLPFPTTSSSLQKVGRFNLLLPLNKVVRPFKLIRRYISNSDFILLIWECQSPKLKAFDPFYSIQIISSTSFRYFYKIPFIIKNCLFI